jgi:NUMOD4 motif/HNH endonuclease
MSERWLPVVGFEGLYEVSDLGRVRSLKRHDRFGRSVRPRILKDGPAGNGYRKVDLSKEGRYTYMYVHIAVLTAFGGPRPLGTECAHRNGIPYDNRYGNLEWKTHVANEADKEAHGTKPARGKHPSARLSEADVTFIRESVGISAASLAEDFGVTANHIRALWRGRYWRAQ